jgi:alcohol dehydrogenase class IV
VHVTICDRIAREPTVDMFRTTLAAARDARCDSVIGFGGGSPMDVAKLVAALLNSKQDIRDVFGIGKLAHRGVYVACVPTTAGTGSEVSPNSVILDEAESLKKAVISPHLVADAAYVDPMLTVSVPREVTAATGMDALTHCIEAYANRFAHPIVDVYALEGIRLIAANLAKAVENGQNIPARTAVALGSLYGGMCLGPVNTAAVHALSYPLGSEFHVAHGVSNAVLLPHVLEFNLPAAPQRYAAIALAMGAEAASEDLKTAARGLQRIRDLSRRVGIPAHMHLLGVPKDAVERMARSAMTVTRLLERNVREVHFEDAIEIYRRAM